MSWHRDREDSATGADLEHASKRRRSAQSSLGEAPDVSLEPVGNSALTRLLQSGRLPAPPSAVAPAGNAAVARSVDAATVQRAALPAQDAGPLDPEIAAAIDAERGRGAPMPGEIRTEMEGHLGVDLSAVRMHTGQQADSLNRAVNAQAFTSGTDVFFSAGTYHPNSSSGRELLAHELTHVAQQATAPAEAGRVSDPADAAEVEARDVAQRVMRSAPGPGPVREAGLGTVARRPATGLVARDPGGEPTPGQQTALVLSAQNIIDVVAHDLKSSISGEKPRGKVLADILMNTFASVTAAGLIAHIGVQALSGVAVVAVSATLNKVASESIVGVASRIGVEESVDINRFVDAWVAEQKWGFAVRLHEIWRQQGRNPTELEQALAKMATANLSDIRHRLYRGVLAAYMESAQRTRGLWDPGSLGRLHVQLRLNGGTVSCRFIGYSEDIQRANKAFERTGVDPLQIGEHGVPVVLTIERPAEDRNIVDDILTVGTLGGYRRGYRYENYWLRPVGVAMSAGGSLKGGVLAMHRYGQLSNLPANWEAPAVATNAGDMLSFEVDGPTRDTLRWTHYGMKFPIPAAFGESGIIGWRTAYR